MDDCELRTELEKHHGESYGWALSCCARSTVEAEAVLQAVYLKVLMGRARYDGRAAFKTWLFAVIRRTAADEQRRQMVRRLLLERRESIARPAEAEPPDETLYRAEVQRVFRRALACLPRRQHEVLQLVFYHDLSLAEAAEVMGVSLGSARTHYDRGKRQLRQRSEVLQINPEARTHEARTGRSDNQRDVPAAEARR